MTDTNGEGTILVIGPHGQMARLEGPTGPTPPCSEAKFKVGDVLRVRRRKHLGNYRGQLCAVAAVVPPNYSPDWAMADLRGRPRPLMAAVGRNCVQYIVGFEESRTPLLIREKYLVESGESPTVVQIEGQIET